MVRLGCMSGMLCATRHLLQLPVPDLGTLACSHTPAVCCCCCYGVAGCDQVDTSDMSHLQGRKWAGGSQPGVVWWGVVVAYQAPAHWEALSAGCKDLLATRLGFMQAAVHAAAVGSTHAAGVTELCIHATQCVTCVAVVPRASLHRLAEYMCGACSNCGLCMLLVLLWCCVSLGKPEEAPWGRGCLALAFLKAACRMPVPGLTIKPVHGQCSTWYDCVACLSCHLPPGVCGSRLSPPRRPGLQAHTCSVLLQVTGCDLVTRVTCPTCWRTGGQEVVVASGALSPCSQLATPPCNLGVCAVPHSLAKCVASLSA
jgi:hypothetical protein